MTTNNPAPAPSLDQPPPAVDESAWGDLDDAAAAVLAAGLPAGARFALGAQISPVQRAFLHERGYLVFDRVASKAEIERILTDLGAAQARLLADGTQVVHGVPVWFGKDPDGAPMLQRLGFSSTLSDFLSAFVRSERFEPVRRLIGDDARIGEHEKDGVVFNQYVNSDQSLRPGLAWHTDALRDVFYNGRMPGPMLNVGLHFDRIRPEDGGLRLLPGTHTQSALSTLLRKVHFLSRAPDPAEIPVETWPGDLTVHDGRMWHRVQASPKRGWESLRRSMYVPYVVDAYAPKDAGAKPLLYLRFFDLIIQAKGAWLRWRARRGRPGAP